MPKVNVYNILGEQVGEMELSDNVFGVDVNHDAIHLVVKSHLANRRQGTQSAKTRAEVSGGGKKPWRQKGTGRARQGSIRSPQWTGGGIVFAPKPRDYSLKVPKKVRRLAMKSALTSKVLSNEMIVLDELRLAQPKTKEMANILSNIKASKKALIVMDEKDVNVIKSARNIPNVETTLVSTLNVYDILKYDSFIITKDAVKKVEEVFA
jgi:large subunit ribosomal protein L4